MDFTSLDDSRLFIFDLLRYQEGEDIALESIIEAYLPLTAGTSPVGSQMHFRPFYVAAQVLQQNPDEQAISEAKGVKFTNYVKVIESWLGFQKAYDLSNALIIPPGMTAQEALDRLCGCSDEGFGGVNLMSAYVV